MKRILLLFLTLVLLLPAAGCRNADGIKAVVAGNGAPLSGSDGPPALVLSAGDGEIQALTPTCTWTGQDGSTVESDGMFVFDLWLDGSLPALPVGPNKEAELRFDAVPDKMRVMAWKAECATHDRSRVGESFDLPVKGDSFRMPTDQEYLYLIAAEWAKTEGVGGSAVYVFATSNGIE